MTMSFEPRDPHFERRVRDSFSRQKAMETLGARVARVAAGEVDLELPFRDDLTQQHGFLHAGIVTTVLDSACGYAAFSLMAADQAVLSVEFKVNLLAPAKGDLLVARARVKRPGRTLTVVTGDAVMVTGEEEVTIATMVGTMMALENRPGLVS
ncbi:MAG: PaaI family thioesterase [Deltaproteobacteria bacterium]|nr:PaaI family thioesterase [Deltaproteobacteria bacterium]